MPIRILAVVPLEKYGNATPKGYFVFFTFEKLNSANC